MTGMLNIFSRIQAGMVDGAKNADTAADKVTIREIEYNPLPYLPDRPIFLNKVILEEALQQEPDDRNQKGREIVERLAILDLEDGQSGGEDEDPTDDGKFVYEGALKNGT